MATILEKEVDNVELMALVTAAAMVAVEQVGRFAPEDGFSVYCWQYLRNNIRYIPEMGEQLIRMPWATIREGRADCKSQTVFTVALCAAHGDAVAVRFARLPGCDYFGHVYAVVNGIPVDPLLPYGKECESDETITIPIPTPSI